MEDLPVVVFAGHNSVIKNRIKLLLSDQEIKFQDVKNRQELLRLLKGQDNQIDLIISDLEVDSNNDFNGISLIKLIKTTGTRIPVIIISSESKKDIVANCLHIGAAEYILKPFKDDYLKEKLLKYIDIETLNKSTSLNFNLNDFLSGEIYKARKGKYSFTLLSVKFNASFEEETNQYSFLNHSDLVYQSIKELFWEADLYIQHGFQSHLGFFPFCTNNSIKVISNKIWSRFQDLKTSEPSLDNYSFAQSYATYPVDGGTVSELLNKLKEDKK
jgi:two-component system, OmpR family, response regulator PhoP